MPFSNNFLFTLIGSIRLRWQHSSKRGVLSNSSKEASGRYYKNWSLRNEVGKWRRMYNWIKCFFFFFSFSTESWEEEKRFGDIYWFFYSVWCFICKDVRKYRYKDKRFFFSDWLNLSKAERIARRWRKREKRVSKDRKKQKRMYKKYLKATIL